LNRHAACTWAQRASSQAKAPTEPPPAKGDKGPQETKGSASVAADTVEIEATADPRSAAEAGNGQVEGGPNKEEGGHGGADGHGQDPQPVKGASGGGKKTKDQGCCCCQ